MALEKVAGSSSVGHPPHESAVCSGLLKAEWDGEPYTSKMGCPWREGWVVRTLDLHRACSACAP